ncbi:Defective Cell Wall [Scheffersomyces stipitis CBS 6054]|uniref:Mannan endo-1,6-alpha-mannosidase n=1 Tax=Scheffersomyces stipitis (strain ATCC 58785 / CBS 6054 / NBRC 10063 / NRRL Y-11545) TaxID=322104 RepID=A3LN37_PICST|nr:Defective Cell Wall [Scheffersomyces stipitis CBS 6054]ABN64791.1 Defective Cell Wall [Scheffersomyces stipitis CBS 6054]
MRFHLLTASVSLFMACASAMWLDTNNDTTIVEATNLIVDGVLDYYDGKNYGGVVGMFVWPYYWWEAGGVWGSLIDYTYFTQNDTLVPLIKEALLYQTGDDNNYVPLNQSTTEGNDDQGFWGIAVMGAAERNFSNPDDDSKAWLTLAQAVFNTMTARWDSAECNGGLRWQIFQWNSGYDYKNSVSNGCLFHIGARLARFTANDTYVDWAEKVWDWMYDIGLLDVVNSNDKDYWFVYDGLTIDNNCSNITKYQWTYNQGLMLSGCAYLYNYTEDQKWLDRTLNLLNASQVFFMKIGSVMYEAACQPSNNCNNDQRSFKAYFSRFLGMTAVMVPQTYDGIRQWLVDSANAAAKNSCTGGTDGHTCGLNWFNSTGWDGYWGLGEQISALEVIQNLRVRDFPPPLTANTGGSSKGNPAAGYSTLHTITSPLELETKDLAGAGIITAVVGVSLVAAGVWLVI